MAKSVVPPGLFYAVVAGPASGIYLVWEEACQEVIRFPDGHLRNFRSNQEALDYLRRHGVSPPSLPPVAPCPSPEIYPFYVVSSSFYGICSSIKTARRRTNGEEIHGCSTFAEAEELLGAQGFLVDPDGRLEADGCLTWVAYRCPPSAGSVPDVEDPQTLVAFCGGSVINNGEYNSIGAFATSFPQHRDWDVVRNVSGPFVTSNRVEYLAALEALLKTNLKDGTAKKSLVIFTDSDLLVKSMTKWVFQWMYDGWVTSNGNQVKNRDLLQLLLQTMGNARAVHFEHVKAHTGGVDWNRAGTRRRG